MNSQKILLSMLLAVSIGCLPLIAVAKGEKANDDEYYIFEDNPGVVLEVLLNDNYNEPAIIKIAGVTVTIDGIDYPNSSESRPSTIIDPFGQAVTLPNGTVIANPDGTVTYKPKPNFKGWDHFHYTFKDDKNKTKEGRVDIRVRGVNDAPVVTGQNHTMDAHDVLTVSAANGLLSTAYDVDQDELTLMSYELIGLLEGNDLGLSLSQLQGCGLKKDIGDEVNDTENSGLEEVLQVVGLIKEQIKFTVEEQDHRDGRQDTGHTTENQAATEGAGKNEEVAKPRTDATAGCNQQAQANNVDDDDNK